MRWLDEKASPSQADWLVFWTEKRCLPGASHCGHASIRTLEEQFVLLVPGGGSRLNPGPGATLGLLHRGA